MNFPDDRSASVRFIQAFVVVMILVVFNTRGDASGDEAKSVVRGVFVRLERVTPEFLATWKAKGARAVVVPLDEGTKRRWERLAKVVGGEGMTLWPWVEVARSPSMADAHPEWMAAIGGHHNDWRSRFPDAPKPKPDQVIKAWPWVPIGYAPALEAHRKRLRMLLEDLPGAWAGAFLNDLQEGPSSCGCGNDQCRWALDYGSASTSEKTVGADAAAKLVAEIRDRHPGKAVVPVWVTECEQVDLPGAAGGTGLCGGVACAKGDCWPAYVRQWNPLLKAVDGPVALALWPETFRRDPARWIESSLSLFQNPPGGTPISAEKTLPVVQAWGKSEAARDAIFERVKHASRAWVIALDPIDQSWEPRTVQVSAEPGRKR